MRSVLAMCLIASLVASCESSVDSRNDAKGVIPTAINHDSIAASAFFPLEIGNFWVYGSGAPGSRRLEVEVIDTLRVHGELWTKVVQRWIASQQTDTVLYRVGSDGAVYERPSVVGDDVFLQPLAEARDSSWSRTSIITERNLTTVVPAGTFVDCFRVWRAMAEDVVELYARNVGLISRHTFRGRFELVQARVGSDVIP